MERFSNGVNTTLDTQILDTDNPAIFEVDNDALPTEPNYIVKVGVELLRVTAVDTSGSPYEYTADRAQEGTVAATHNIGEAIIHIISAGGLSKILEEQNEYLETANVADNRVGRVQNVNQKTLIDTGSAFNHWFVDRFRVTPIDVGDFGSVHNTDDLVTSDVNGIYKIKRPNPTVVGHSLIASPVGSPFTDHLIIAFQLATGAIASEVPAFGIGVFDSSNNKHVIALHGISDSAPYVLNKIERWTNFTTLHSTPVSLPALPASLIFMRVEFDGTNITFFYSYDGAEYIQLGQVLESFLTIDEFVIVVSPFAVANLFHVGA